MDAQESQLLMGNWESPSSLSFPCSHCVWGCSKWSHILGNTHTHTRTSTATYRSLLLTPSLPSLHLSFPIQINTIDQLAIRLQNDHITINTHTHTLPLHLARERVDGYNKDWLARAASSRCAKSSAAAAALWSVRRLYWFSYGRFICCWTVLNAHFLLSCYTLIKGRLEAGRWGGLWREWRRDEIKTRG